MVSQKKITNKSSSKLKLRVSVAIDIREEKTIEVRLPETKELIGIFDIRFSPVLHTCDTEISPKYIPEINKQGLELNLTKGNNPIFLFSETPGFDHGPNIFLPQLIISENSPAEQKTRFFLDKLLSLNSIQPFGWMEGCVLDGLWQIYKYKADKRAFETIKHHLAMFFDYEGNFIHEGSRSNPYDNKISGIESTLPFAIMAQVYPEHKIYGKVIDFWKHHTKENGVIVDNVLVSAEGSYTIAYPMAVLGKIRNDKDLLSRALKQLKLRKEMLVKDGNNYLRYYPDKTDHTYKNWARGLAWYMLGLARTLPVLEQYFDINDLVSEFNRVAEFVAKHQKGNGLWSCFVDKQEVITDTSGSAGISAALISGVKYGYLDKKYIDLSNKTWSGLQNYLTVDGMLSGVAQSNRNGEAFQASDYRVISQMGMGLAGQLFGMMNGE